MAIQRWEILGGNSNLIEFLLIYSYFSIKSRLFQCSKNYLSVTFKYVFSAKSYGKREMEESKFYIKIKREDYVVGSSYRINLDTALTSNDFDSLLISDKDQINGN